ncbi:MAG TPA: cysteine--tRNA ligase [Actinomycetota bacterium]|nr:cysteine--tRNA ligase [Actinomycetota bacterium]
MSPGAEQVPLQLFNTLGRRVEEFTSGGEVSVYVCGVTPYDTTHVGHARTYLVFDVLIRHLLHKGLRVDYIQNITDVDESIVKRAAQLGEPYDELGDRFAGIYMEDVAALGMIPARTYPRASEAIPEMQELIRRLLATERAYRADGNVYMSVGDLATYGELSRLDRARMLDIESHQDGSTVGDERKRDPLDVLLWRRTDASGPSWESPWGPGRPGWHIECSTLALKHLGRQIDIHGGGGDLIFPHHEAEIAQSEAVTGMRPFVRFWVHVGMVQIDGHKMAKSAGNMVFVRDLLKTHAADALRLYLLSIHYRSIFDFNEGELEKWAVVASEMSHAAHVAVNRDSSDDSDLSPVLRRFETALNTDLDTATAITVIRSLAEDVLGDKSHRAQRLFRKLAARLGLSLEA